jgi:hypothetical protein
MSMKSTVLWDLMPYIPIDHRRFGGTYCLIVQGLGVNEVTSKGQAVP